MDKGECAVTGVGEHLRLRLEDPVWSHWSRHRHHHPRRKDNSYEHSESLRGMLVLGRPELDYLGLSG